jgi:Holliday junction resolvase RusA-like endonuclease
MSRVLVTFSAEVKPLQRPALVANGYGGVRYKDSAPYREYKAVLRRACELALPEFWSPYDGPVEIRIVCQYSQPSSRPKAEWKDTTPDWDNLAKPVQDALTKLVFTDDKTVALARVAKVYGVDDRVTVQVRTVDGREVLDDWMFDPGPAPQ